MLKATAAAPATNACDELGLAARRHHAQVGVVCDAARRLDLLPLASRHGDREDVAARPVREDVVDAHLSLIALLPAAARRRRVAKCAALQHCEHC